MALDKKRKRRQLLEVQREIHKYVPTGSLRHGQPIGFSSRATRSLRRFVLVR